MCVLFCSFSTADKAPIKSASSGQHLEIGLGLALEVWLMNVQVLYHQSVPKQGNSEHYCTGILYIII